MSVDVRAIFDQQLELSSEIMSSGQELAAFDRVCDLFFSVVLLNFAVSSDLLLSAGAIEGSRYSADELQLGVGIQKYKVTSIDAGFNSLALRIKVRPLEYLGLLLDVELRDDFRMCCDFVILTVTKANFDVLQGIGVANNDVQAMQFQEVRALLEKRYASEIGETVYA